MMTKRRLKKLFCRNTSFRTRYEDRQLELRKKHVREYSLKKLHPAEHELFFARG